MDRPQTQTGSYGFNSSTGSLMQNRGFASNSSRPANPKPQGWNRPFDDSPFFERRNEGNTSRSHRDDDQDFRGSDRGFFDSDRSYRNGNSAPAERVRDVRSQNYNSTRQEHIDSGRNSYRRSRSPIIKETMVMLQDDRRSVYGKYSYTIPKVQPAVRNYKTATQPRKNFKPPAGREQQFKPKATQPKNNVQPPAGKGQKFKPTAPKKSNPQPPTSNKPEWKSQTPNVASRKRKRPPPNNNPVKKLKIRRPEEGIQMAIVAEGTTISQSQVDIIKTHLLDKIDAIPIGGTSPGFTDLKYTGGHLALSCANQVSRDWLEAEMTGCVLWNDVKLKVVEAKELDEPMKVKVYIPGPRIEPEKLFRRLRVQNKGLDTSSWYVTGKLPVHGGVMFFIELSEKSWERIAELDRKPHFNFTRLKFKAIGRWSFYNLDSSTAAQQKIAGAVVECAETGGPAEAVETAGTACVEENVGATADIEENVDVIEVADSTDANDSDEAIKIEDFVEILDPAGEFSPADGQDNNVDEPTTVTDGTEL